MNEINYRELTFASPFLCRVQDGNIYDAQGNHIGVGLAKHKEALDLLSQYKDLLEKHGILKKEKTPAEIQAEMQTSITALTEMVQSLTDKLGKMETTHDKQGSGDESRPTVQGKGKS